MDGNRTQLPGASEATGTGCSPSAGRGTNETTSAATRPTAPAIPIHIQARGAPPARHRERDGTSDVNGSTLCGDPTGPDTHTPPHGDRPTVPGDNDRGTLPPTPVRDHGWPAL
ncbi:hypothetical protein GCM10010440_59690 [Kitasatospora cinereorecta]